MFLCNHAWFSPIYTLSLHDALPIFNIFSIIGVIMLMGLVTKNAILLVDFANRARKRGASIDAALAEDRKSTRLNSSHLVISYAVFCLKKKINKHLLQYI